MKGILRIQGGVGPLPPRNCGRRVLQCVRAVRCKQAYAGPTSLRSAQKETCLHGSRCWFHSGLGNKQKTPFRRSTVAKVSKATTDGGVHAVSLERERPEVALDRDSQSLRVHFQSGQIFAAGCQPMLQDVNAEVFLCRSNDRALILGVESTNGPNSMHDIALAKLACKRFLACSRCKLWWMTPEWGKEGHEVPPETQFILLELSEGGPYGILLPLIDNNTFRATLRPHKLSEPQTTPEDPDKHIFLRIESGDKSVQAERWNQALYIAAGWDPFELVDRAVADAASLSGGAKPRAQKQFPPSLDVFGWCTWDAFYSKISSRGLHQGLQSLTDGGIPPKLLIIDDGWQSTDIDSTLREDVSDRLRLPEKNTELDETQGEFIEAELEMLQMSAKNIPAGSALGVALQALLAEDDDTLLSQARVKTDPSTPWRKSKEERRKKKLAKQGKVDYDSDDSWSQDTMQSYSDELEPSRLPQAIERAQGEVSTSGRDNRKLPQRLADAFQRADIGLLSDDDKRKLVKAAGLKELQPEVLEPRVPQQPQKPMMWLLTAVGQRFVGLLLGLIQGVLIVFYQYVVDPAPAHSWPNRLFTSLAKGPIRGLLLQFFAASGDFTRRLTAIEANSKFSSPWANPDDYFSGAPPQLGSVVKSLKKRFNLSYIYCWHGLPGYWSGVAPPEEAPSMAKYDAKLVFAQPTPGLYEIEPSSAYNPSVVSGVGVVNDPDMLYQDMHAYLAGEGITGVKVDCQAGVGLVGSELGGGPALAAKYQTALEDSAARYFQDNHVINCMCHSTENLYRMRDTAVIRASDDFYPRNPASSQPHIASCVFNSLYIGALAQPDWDMFHSKHPAAELHATARAVSGGAIYVSDKPGQHDFDILRRLVLPDGSVLRALMPGRPTRDTIFADVLRDNKSLCKVWNVNACGGIVGVFHLQGSSWDRNKRQFQTHDKSPRELQTKVSPRDVEWTACEASSSNAWQDQPPTFYAAFSTQHNRIFKLRRDQSIPITLKGAQSSVVSMAPILEANGVQLAAIGLTDMLNSNGAVLSCSLKSKSTSSSNNGLAKAQNGNGAVRSGSTQRATGFVEARGCGRFEMYSNTKPVKCVLSNSDLEFSYSESTERLSVELPMTETMRHDLQIQF